MDDLPLARLADLTCWRVIPSRYPPVDLFRSIAPPEDWPILQEVESATNERLRGNASLAGAFSKEPIAERSSSHYITGPIAHPHPEGTRFSDPDFGAMYAALDLETAIAEVRLRREQFFRYTHSPAQRADMRVVMLKVAASLYDIRGDRGTRYIDAKEALGLGRSVRTGGGDGLVFDSEVKPGGECICIFRPNAVHSAVQERHLSFIWNGVAIQEILEYRAKIPG